MKIVILLLVTLLFTSCLEPLTEEEAGREYTVHARLIANEKVDSVSIRKIVRYIDYDSWKQDSAIAASDTTIIGYKTKIIKGDTIKYGGDTTIVFGDTTVLEKYLDMGVIPIKDAKITLSTGDSLINLSFNEVDVKRFSYHADHIVIPGATYNLTVTLFDTTMGEELRFTSTTTVPHTDPSLKLDSDTLLLDTTFLKENFWNIKKDPSIADHITLTSNNSENYRLFEFTAMGGHSLFSVNDSGSIAMGQAQIPERAMPRIISPLSLLYWGKIYPSWRIVVRNVQSEYVNLYREDATEKSYWHVLPTSIYSEGISNIEGANGIFTASATDTLNFKVKLKE